MGAVQRQRHARKTVFVLLLLLGCTCLLLKLKGSMVSEDTPHKHDTSARPKGNAESVHRPVVVDISAVPAATLGRESGHRTTPSRVMVVAQYNEPLEWLYRIDGFAGKVIVYKKSPSNTALLWGGAILNTSRAPPGMEFIVKEVPNEGRESGTYLTYIIDNYDNLPDQIWFTQADPFQHHWTFLSFFRTSFLDAHDAYTDNGFQSLSKQWKAYDDIPPQRFVKVNNAFEHGVNGVNGILYTINKHTLQHVGHSRVLEEEKKEWSASWYAQRYSRNDVLDSLCEKVGISPPKHTHILYAYGASFYVPRASILRHPREVYVKLQQFLVGDDRSDDVAVWVGRQRQKGNRAVDPRQGYILERFWHYLFTGQSCESLTECYESLISVAKQPIVAVYSEYQQKIWVKRLAADSIAKSEANGTVVFMRGDDPKVRFLPGMDYNGGTMLHIEECNSLRQAELIYFYVAFNK